MSNIRIIPRLDIKGPNLIKGIHLEGVRVIGNPNNYARQYYEDGADEIIYMDAVASLYGRNNLTDIVYHTVQNVFLPITAGGGVRSVDDVMMLLRVGADKVAINTAAVKNPNLITEVAHRFGSQCMVLSIEAKKIRDNKWEAYTDNGREHTYLDVVEWSKKGVELGAGEILLTSVDYEGTRKGFDIELIETVSKSVKIPVIACGGMGSVEHLVNVVEKGKADAVAMSDIIHYKRKSMVDIREESARAGIQLRQI